MQNIGGFFGGGAKFAFKGVRGIVGKGISIGAQGLSGLGDGIVSVGGGVQSKIGGVIPFGNKAPEEHEDTDLDGVNMTGFESMRKKLKLPKITLNVKGKTFEELKINEGEMKMA